MKGLGFYGEDFFVIKTDEELIRENIIRILLTSPGERPMSNFGCKLKGYLFEQANVLFQEVEDEIKKSINKWEPRVTVSNISVDEIPGDNTAVRLKLSCTIKENLNNLNLDTIIRV